MNKELRLRIISALVLGAIALIATWLGGMVFTILVVIAGLLIYYEWGSIIELPHAQPGLNFLGWACLTVSFACLFFNLINYALLILVSGAVISAILGFKNKSNIWVSAGILYAGLAVIALSELRGEGPFGLFAIIFIFVVVWSTDIFAFFCGKALGGPKLAPAISPGKTWSGSIFGLAAGVGAGLFAVMLTRVGGGLFIPIVALLLSASSQIGDLFESWIKRRFEVKDSSNLIPGHGGFMDRLDGVIFAAIMAFVIASIDQYYSGTDSWHVLAVHLLGL